jgi:hypothetical protein
MKFTYVANVSHPGM